MEPILYYENQVSDWLALPQLKILHPEGKYFTVYDGDIEPNMSIVFFTDKQVLMELERFPKPLDLEILNSDTFKVHLFGEDENGYESEDGILMTFPGYGFRIEDVGNWYFETREERDEFHSLIISFYQG